jgi:ATP-binding cassette subfamily C (CFTR/MRP) protein 1
VSFSLPFNCSTYVLILSSWLITNTFIEQVIRTPMIFLPVVLASSADAAVALERISKYLLAEELGEPFMLEGDSEWAVEINNGSFVWETATPTHDPKKGKKGKTGKTGGDAKDDLEKKEINETKRGKGLKEGLFRNKKAASSAPKLSNERDALSIHSGASSITLTPTPQACPSIQSREEDEKPFELRNLNLQIPKGSFVAIVGRVGTGTSSLLQSIIGEMRKTGGEIVMGGTIAYVPQAAWIMNASLRNNILFG